MGEPDVSVCSEILQDRENSLQFPVGIKRPLYIFATLLVVHIVSDFVARSIQYSFDHCIIESLFLWISYLAIKIVYILGMWCMTYIVSLYNMSADPKYNETKHKSAMKIVAICSFLEVIIAFSH